MAAKPSPTAPAPKVTSTKKEFLLFISIPVGIILLIVLVLFVPSFFAKPGYDFIYTHCPTYDCSSSIVINKDGVAKEVGSQQSDSYNSYDRQQAPDIYYHDTQNNSSRRIEFTEVSTYKLDPSNVSPDGYTVSRGSSSGSGFLLWGDSSDDQWYLKKSSLQKKSLNLEPNDYYSNINLVGWVEK